MTHVERLARNINFAWKLAAIVLISWLLLPIGKDDTDPPGWTGFYRSGMRVLTDAQTGCQYLQAGGLTPRLDADGRHMGCRRPHPAP